MGEQTIKPRHNLQLTLGSLLFVLVVILSACGGSDNNDDPITQAATEIPPTPRSTPLPLGPTPIVFGTDEDPIQFAFVSEDSELFELAEVVDPVEDILDGVDDEDGTEVDSDVEATDEPDVSETEEAGDETQNDTDEEADDSVDSDATDSPDVESTQEADSDEDTAATEELDDEDGDEEATLEPTENANDDTDTGDEENGDETATVEPEELDPEGDGSPRGNLEAQLNFRLANENQSPSLRYLGLSLAIQVERFENMRDALDAVCNGKPTLVWVDAFTYIAAEQACGAQPLFAIRLSDEEIIEGLTEDITVDAETGFEFDIVYNTRLGTLPNGLADLADTTVCRLSADDPISWIYFSLTLRGAGLNPITNLAGVIDVDDYAAMVLDILSDEEETCQVGAIPRGTLPDILEFLADEADEDEEFPEIDLDAADTPIRLLDQGDAIWAEVPHMVLIAPSEPLLPAEFREAIVTSLDELLEDINNDALDVEDVLAPFLNYVEIVAVDADDYDEFREWLAAARWQMAP